MSEIIKPNYAPEIEFTINFRLKEETFAQFLEVIEFLENKPTIRFLSPDKQREAVAHFISQAPQWLLEEILQAKQAQTKLEKAKKRLAEKKPN